MTPPPSAAVAAPARTRPRSTARPAKRPVRAVELAGAVAQHRLLDRLIRGRAWIGVLAFALIGIVAMQLWLLKLNAGIGRAIEHESLLARENTALKISNSEASSGDLVEQMAAAEGLSSAAPGAQRFLSARGAMDTRMAAAALARPVKAPAPVLVPVPSTSTATTTSAATTSATVSPTAGGTQSSVGG